MEYPPAALLNSSSDRSIFPGGGAGSVMCTQLSAFSTTFTSMPSGSSRPYSYSTAFGSRMKRAFKASSLQHAVNSLASAVFCSDIEGLQVGWLGQDYRRRPAVLRLVQDGGRADREPIHDNVSSVDSC